MHGNKTGWKYRIVSSSYAVSFTVTANITLSSDVVSFCMSSAGYVIIAI
jgi:hypothetical protein